MTHPTTRWPRCIAALSLVSLVCLAGPAGAAPLLGLLPVSVEGAVGAPDRTDAVSRRLAAVLEGPGGFRVVSLEEPVQPAGATARAVRGWALDTGAEAVVVGHLEGGQLWLQLRSGHSGGLLGGWCVRALLERQQHPGVLGGRSFRRVPSHGAAWPAAREGLRGCRRHCSVLPGELSRRLSPGPLRARIGHLAGGEHSLRCPLPHWLHRRSKIRWRVLFPRWRFRDSTASGSDSRAG